MKQKTTRSLFLPRALKNSVFITVCALALALVFSAFQVIRKETVQFTAKDGLVITADHYINAEDQPYILLFHEQESSRGEFDVIARKLCKMDYNCLAVDLRNGGSAHSVSNETAKRCREDRCLTGPEQVEMDMLAAIDYAYTLSSKPVVLLGSSANGSLSLKLAKDHKLVKAVVAFSPGEYFLPGVNIRESITGMEKPAFVSSSLAEITYVDELASGIDSEHLTLFKPEMGQGARGTYALSTDTDNYSEYWLALLLFFKDLL